MPYTKQNYPDWLKGAPEGVVDVFVAAFNSAYEDYADDDDREAISQRVARAAVKKAGWTQDADGKWHEKAGEAAPEIRLTGDVLRESAIRETVMPEGGLVIRESADGVKRIVAPLLRVGFSKNSAAVESRRGKSYPRYYPEGEVREAAATANGKVIYVGFDEHNDKVDVAKELGVYEGAVFEGGEIRGAVRVYPDQNWVVDRLRVNPRAFGGLSIEGNCNRHALATVDDREAAVVQGLQIQCARLVKSPAAAGPVEGIQESEIKTRKGGERMKLADLNESERDDVMREAKGIVEAEQGVKVKDAKIAELTEAVKAKDAELAKLAEAANEAKSHTLVEAAMPKDKAGNHVLPEKARAKLHESLKGVVDEAKIAEAVKDMAELIAEAANAGAPRGAGMSAPASSGETVKESQQLCDNLMGVVEPEPPKP